MSISLLQILVTCVIGVILHLSYKSRTRSIARRAAIAGHDCKPPTAYPQKSLFARFAAQCNASAVAESKTQSACQIQAHLPYGNTLSTKDIMRSIISTTEPDNVEAVLFTHVGDYGISWLRIWSFRKLFDMSFFLSWGKEWKQSRDLLQLSMTKSRVEDLRMFEVHVGNLIFALSRQNSGIVDLGIWFPRLIADITTEIVFGQSMGTIEKPDSTGFLRALHEAQMVCENNATLGPPTSGEPRMGFCDKFHENVRKVNDFIDGQVIDGINLHESTTARQDSGSFKEEEGPGSFLEELCNLTDNENFLCDESLTMFSATFEPVSTLLINLFFVLAKRPDLWELLRGEVGSLEGGKPEKGQLQDMKYHQFCLKESLRLRPIISSFYRVADQDTILPRGGGPDGNSPIFVTEGTTIAFSIAAMHRRKDLWGEDADEFCPERWINEKPSWQNLRAVQKFIPFSGGPRVCLGQDFAMDMATYILVRLVQNFQSIKSRDTCDRAEDVHLAYTDANGPKVVMKAG